MHITNMKRHFLFSRTLCFLLVLASSSLALAAQVGGAKAAAPMIPAGPPAQTKKTPGPTGGPAPGTPNVPDAKPVKK